MVLANFFAFSPLPLQVYDPDGRSLLVNDAFRALFGAEPPLAYRVFGDEGAERAGAVDALRRAFAGETVRLPPAWYDPREVRHVEVAGGRRVAVEANFVPLFGADGRVAFVVILFHDRTEEMRYRGELERERERLRLALKAGALGVWDWHAGSPTTVFWNERMKRLFGLEGGDGDVDTAAFLAGVHPDDRAAVYEANVRAVDPARREPYAYEYRVLWPDGTTRWLRAEGQAAFSGEGRLERFTGVALDVTERRRLEELTRRVRESEERFRHLVEVIPVGIALFDRALRYVEINRALTEDNGLPREAHLGRTLAELFPAHPNNDAIAERLRSVLASGEPLANVEVAWVTPGPARRERYSLASYFPLREGGEVAGVGVAVVDISARRRAERQLEVRVGRLARLQAFTARLAAAQGSDEIARAVLSEGREAFGAPRLFVALRAEGDDALKVAWSEGGAPGALSWERLPAAEGGPLWGAAADGALRYYPDARALAEAHPRLAAKRPPGAEALLALPLPLGGRAIGALALSFDAPFDLTEDRQSDLEAFARLCAQAFGRALLFDLAQAERHRAEEATRAKDEFLAVVSHELRTPLNAMLGWLQMLREGGLAGEGAAKALETVERNARVQARLVDDLLDVSRVIAGKLRLEPAEVDLADVVRAALDAVTPAATARGVHLEAVLDPGLGPLRGDPGRLQQVAWNLLSNAVKFTPKGGRVQIVLRRVDSVAELAVADTGRGIDPAFLPHVFEPFRQAETAGTKGGLGLGLAIVKHLVEMHGGTIEAGSEGPGRGATFVVRLPLAPPRAPGPPAGRPRAGPPGPACPPELDGLRVLVVDDDDDARARLRSVCEGCKARVDEASSAAEALRLLRERRPDVLVSALGLPGEGGSALLERVRRLPPDEGGRTPAAALTAFARAEDRTRALVAGFDLHLPKPVDPAELVAVVASLARRAR